MKVLRLAMLVIERAAALVIGVLLIVMVAIVLSQFFDRYFTPIWAGVPADEYVKVGLVWLTFIGFGLAMRAGVEIRVDFVDQHVPARVRNAVYGVIDLVLLGMIGLILWKSVQLYRVGTLQTILGTEMTLALPVVGMMVGCALMFVAILARMLGRAREVLR
jgi:TRAP-type C4-dicarboxylate transport system permease small subunit